MGTSAPRPGLRERKNRRTRHAIVEATVELTLESGYASATIPKIAERADVAPRTVSTWFPAKDDILFEGAEEQIARGISHLRTGTGDIVDRLLAWFGDEAARATPDPDVTRLRRAAIQHDPELRGRFRQLLETMQLEVASAVAKDSGSAADDMGPVLVAGAAMAFLDKLSTLSSEDSRAASDAQVAVGVEFLRAGLASITPAGD